MNIVELIHGLTNVNLMCNLVKGVITISSFQFLACNKLLKEVNNPYVELISINEAIERNIKIEDFVLNDTKINKDEQIIMICESEEELGELEIKHDMYYSSEYAKEYSSKQYFSELQFSYTEARCKQLLDYIFDQFKCVDEIEIWSIWLDYYQPAKIRTIKINDLTVTNLVFLDISKGFERPECLVIVK